MPTEILHTDDQLLDELAAPGESAAVPFQLPTMQEIIKRYAVPTPRSAVVWRAFSFKGSEQGGYTAIAIPHIEIGYVRQLLNNVVSPFGWQTAVDEKVGLIFVGLGILNPDTKEWVWRWDTGQDTPDPKQWASDLGGGRGLVSRGIKRAAKQWGIGADLDDLTKPYCKCDAKRNYKDKSLILKEGKPQFGKWIDSPWDKIDGVITAGGSRQTTPAPKPATEQTMVTSPAPAVTDPPVVLNGVAGPSANEFFHIAYNKLKWEREQALSLLKVFSEEEGAVDYLAAIFKIEEQLPPEDRSYTSAQAELDAPKDETDE